MVTQEMTAEFMTMVMLTGLIIVFIGLIILIVFINVMDAVMRAAEKKKKNADSEILQPEKVIKPLAAMEIEDGISDEIVAVIAAAATALSPEYKIAGIRKSDKRAVGRRTLWGSKGIVESTSYFQ